VSTEAFISGLAEKGHARAQARFLLRVSLRQRDVSRPSGTGCQPFDNRGAKSSLQSSIICLAEN